MDYVNEIFVMANEFKALGIPTFQCDKEIIGKYLNKCFLGADAAMRDHKVNSVHFLGNYIVVQYIKTYSHEVHVYIGIDATYRKTVNKYGTHITRNATEGEINGVYEYVKAIISERKSELEKSLKNPDFETSKNSLGEFADNYLSRNYPKFECRQRYGSTEIDKTRRFAFVICSKEENDAMAQMGYISFSRNDNGEYGFKVSSLGIGYDCGTSDFSECEKILGNAIDFILN